MEEPLLRAAGAIAHNHSLLLGVAYKLADPTLGGRFTSRNMLVVLRRNGSVALRCPGQPFRHPYAPMPLAERISLGEDRPPKIVSSTEALPPKPDRILPTPPGKCPKA